MSRLFALAAVVGFVAYANAQCIPLGEAALDAGLTSLVDAVTTVQDVEGAGALLDAVNATEEVTSPITLFAPTNEAFDEISAVLATLSPEEVLAVLLNHVVAQNLTAEAITTAIEDASPAPAKLDSLLGLTLEASLPGESVIVEPAGTGIMSLVMIPDVQTCAGTVHVVDMVLVPADAGAPSAAPLSAMSPASVPGVGPTSAPGADVPVVAPGVAPDVAPTATETSGDGLSTTGPSSEGGNTSSALTSSVISGVVAIVGGAMLIV